MYCKWNNDIEAPKALDSQVRCEANLFTSDILNSGRKELALYLALINLAKVKIDFVLFSF